MCYYNTYLSFIEDLLYENLESDRPVKIIKEKYETLYYGIQGVEIELEDNLESPKKVKFYGNSDIMFMMNDLCDMYSEDPEFRFHLRYPIYVNINSIGSKPWTINMLDSCFYGLIHLKISTNVRENLNTLYPFNMSDYVLKEKFELQISLSSVLSVLKYLKLKFNSLSLIYIDFDRGGAVDILKDIAGYSDELYKYVKYIYYKFDFTVFEYTACPVLFSKSEKDYIDDLFEDLVSNIKPNRFKLSMYVYSDANISSKYIKGWINMLSYINNYKFPNNVYSLVVVSEEDECEK